MARLLISAPQLLLLDEPTNHLDISALEWLERWLAAYPGAVLIVSHDRTFLDRTVNRIVALDPATHQSASYAGYTAYVEAVVKARDKQWSQYRDQVVEAERLKRDAQQTMARAVHKENATKAPTSAATPRRSPSGPKPRRSVWNASWTPTRGWRSRAWPGR